MVTQLSIDWSYVGSLLWRRRSRSIRSQGVTRLRLLPARLFSLLDRKSGGVLNLARRTSSASPAAVVRKINPSTRKAGSKGGNNHSSGYATNLVVSASSSLPKEMEGILANLLGGAELRGCTTKGSSGLLVCVAPEEDSLTSSLSSTLVSFKGDDVEADSPPFRFCRFGRGSSSSSSSSTSSLGEVAEGSSSSSYSTSASS